MKVETFVGTISSKMSGTTKWQFKFTPHVIRLFLSMRTGRNYLKNAMAIGVNKAFV
jgi:hypothetical protein